MKIVEGSLSDLPSKSSTGLVGLIAKHRAGIDASFNMRAEKLKIHAYARALIEALGGQKGKDDGWEVELSLAGSDATQEQQIKDLTLQVQGLKAQYQSMAELLAELHSRMEKLETPTPRKRSPKADEKPTEPQGE